MRLRREAGSLQAGAAVRVLKVGPDRLEVRGGVSSTWKCILNPKQAGR